MSMSDDDTGVVLDGDGNPVLSPGIRAQMRQQEKDLKESQQRLREYEARAVFAEVGVPDSGPGKFFRDHYSGPLDRDSVEKAAKEAGAVGSAPPPDNTDEEARLQAELDRIRGVAGASGDTGGDGDMALLKEVEAEMRRIVREGTEQEFDDYMQSPKVQSLKERRIIFS